MNDHPASVAARSAHRTDIQAMRGLAVLLVVVYHSGLGIASAGYLGVDMFFVISGFLITGIVTRGVRRGRFSFVDFYSRRARRLLPAAYTVLAVTTAASAWLLTTTQYRQFLVNLAGSLFFSANFTLWSQTGYFAPNSAFEPLLHMWSLAIEEQYYLLVPVVLFLVPRSHWFALLVATTALSLVGGVYLATIKPSIAFFWLPSRAWELGIGSIAALVWEKERVRRAARVLLVPGLLALLITPFVRLPGPTPGLGAVLICLGAVTVILARTERASDVAAVRGLAWVGDLSYSLYLVHWPLFALTRATQLSADLSVPMSLGLIALSFLLAVALHRSVEQPLRSADVHGRKLFVLALSGALIILGIAWGLGKLKPQVAGSAQLTKPIEGLGKPNCFSEDVVRFDGQCTQSPAPRMLLWGDSYSAHLVPGLIATARQPIAQASKGHCSPFANYAAVATSNEYEWTKGCLIFNASVVDYIRHTQSLEVIILAGFDPRTLSGAAEYAIRTASDGSIARAPLGIEQTVRAKRETVAMLRALGKRVVLIASPPPSPFDLGICWQRQSEGVPITGPYRDCDYQDDNSTRSARKIQALLAGFEDQADVPVIRLGAGLCQAGRCLISNDGKPLFRDAGHFTEWGSKFVGQRLDLGARVWAVAR